MPEKKPSYYAESADGRFRFMVWAPPSETGDGLCLGLTGKREHQLVEAILSGAYDHIFQSRRKKCRQAVGIPD